MDAGLADPWGLGVDCGLGLVGRVRRGGAGAILCDVGLYHARLWRRPAATEMACPGRYDRGKRDVGLCLATAALVALFKPFADDLTITARKD